MSASCRSVPSWPAPWRSTGRPDFPISRPGVPRPPRCGVFNMTIDKQLPSTRTTEIDSICLKAEVIPVITIERLEDAVPLARALVEGGLTVLEVTLRTDCALEAVRRIKAALPQASVGVGTVLTPAQYR